MSMFGGSRRLSTGGATEVGDLRVGRKGHDFQRFVDALTTHSRLIGGDLSSYSSSNRPVVGTPDRGFLEPDADRLAFPDRLEGCDLGRFLSPYTKAPYEEPAVLRGGPPRTATKPRPRFRGS